MKKLILATIVVAFQFLVQPMQTRAAWGDFDASFGFLGAHLDDNTDLYPYDVTVQSDGKILVTGYRLLSTGKQRFFLRRYLSNGQVDTAFGSGGSAVPACLIAGDANYRGHNIAVMADGRIAVAGIGNGYPAIWRFHSDGQPDTSIGIGGCRSLSSYPSVEPAKVGVQGNKLIVSVQKTGRLAVLRLNNNGSIDTTFGDQGEVLSIIYGSSYSMFVESPSGKITMGGVSTLDYTKIRAERLLINGQYDGSFVSDEQTSPSNLPPGKLLKLSNLKYVFSVYKPFPLSAWWAGLLELNMTGMYESTVWYQTGAETYGHCSVMLDEQQNGKVVVSFSGKLHRFNTDLDLGTTETNTCLNLAQLDNRAPPELQPDDKMLTVGRYVNGGNLTLIRTLAD